MHQSIDRRATRRASAQPLVLLFGIVALSTAFTRPAAAQVPSAVAPAQAGLHGAITTQNGAVFLPGVSITVSEGKSGTTVAEATSDAAGHYAVGDLPPGTY